MREREEKRRDDETRVSEREDKRRDDEARGADGRRTYRHG